MCGRLDVFWQNCWEANHCSRVKSEWRDNGNSDYPCSYIDQLNLILGVLGTPDDETLDRVGSENASEVISC